MLRRKPLALSAFTIDDYEQALYHNDPWTSPTPLIVEIHSTLLNALILDLTAGHEAVRPLACAGNHGDNDTDYWEGKKGATTETLRPVTAEMAEQWKLRELSMRDTRKGWEAALVGCLWERATLETLPNYLNNILHLTFEDKPAPTRPTWSTGPSQASGQGLVAAKPEKRYSTLHHLHKLDIITFLIELVAQTAAVRDFLEESTAALTEVRKDQVEAKREWKRIQAEKDALEPKDKAHEENGNGDGDISMEMKHEALRPVSPEISVNGLANGTATGTERDELEESPFDDDMLSSPPESEGHNQAAATRRKALQERAAEREAEEAVKTAKVARDREDARVKKAEGKQQTAERKKLAEDEESTAAKMKSLEYEFRSHFYALRARPMGMDRFSNSIWWLDGCGSAPLIGEHGRVLWGTGRLYIQGAEIGEVEWCRLPEEITAEEVESRRKVEEGEGRLGPGEWASYDTQDQVSTNFLNIPNSLFPTTLSIAMIPF